MVFLQMLLALRIISYNFNYKKLYPADEAPPVSVFSIDALSWM